MKFISSSITHPFSWLLFVSLTLTLLNAQEPLDPKKLEWYDSWVTQVANDAPPEMYISDPVELRKVQAEEQAYQDNIRARLLREPDTIVYVRALFWRHYRIPESNGADGVPSLLEALAARPDLKEADVADIAAEVDRILASPCSGWANDHDNYMLSYYCIRMIRKFPTPANIDRCVRTITRSDSVNWWDAKRRSLPALSETGTADTLPVVEQTLAWMAKHSVGSPENDFPYHDTQEAKKLVAAMKQRLAAEAAGTAVPPSAAYAATLAATAAAAKAKAEVPPAASPAASSSGSGPTSNSTPPEPKAPAAAAAPAGKSSLPLLLLAAALLALPGWLLVRKHRSRATRPVS